MKSCDFKIGLKAKKKKKKLPKNIFKTLYRLRLFDFQRLGTLHKTLKENFNFVTLR